MNDFIPQLPFRSHLLAKLNLIVWAERGKRRAARRMGLCPSTFFRWLSGKYIPDARHWALIDERYALAVEKHRLKLARRQARKPAASDFC